MSESRPSSIRARALDEYEVLRRTADELDGIALRLHAEGSSAVDEALVLTTKLLRQLRAYVDLQQLLVLPTVRQVDIWGHIRADLLAKDHESRRDELAAIERSHCRPVHPSSLACDLRDFARALRADLAREERDVFGGDAMRDDVVETEPD